MTKEEAFTKEVLELAKQQGLLETEATEDLCRRLTDALGQALYDRPVAFQPLTALYAEACQKLGLPHRIVSRGVSRGQK